MNTPEDFRLLNVFIKYEDSRRKAVVKELEKEVAAAPVSDATLGRLAELSNEDLTTIMRSHPGFELHRALESVWTMLAVFEQAVTDLQASCEQFSNAGQIDDVDARKARENELIRKVNKDILSASTASTALVEYSRRAKKAVSAVAFDEQLGRLIDAREHTFICKLRNNLAHFTHLEAHWQKTFKSDGTVSRFLLKRAEILAEGDFNLASKAFISSQPEHIDIGLLFAHYCNAVTTFYKWFKKASEENMPWEIADYRRCVIAQKRAAARTGYRILLTSFLKAKVDPYKHLHKFLGKDTLSLVLSLPSRSSQRVDLIIQTMDENECCDDEIRQLTCQLFGVT
jgi:hypothetical protein